MKLFMFFAVLISAIPAFSGMQTTGCRLVMKNRVTELNLIAQNLANVNTTRTASGSPYLKQSLVCVGEKCRVEKSPRFLNKYAPEHPDADANGIVKYPDIDVNSEMKAMIKASQEYDAAAEKCF